MMGEILQMFVKLSEIVNDKNEADKLIEDYENEIRTFVMFARSIEPTLILLINTTANTDIQLHVNQALRILDNRIDGILKKIQAIDEAGLLTVDMKIRYDSLLHLQRKIIPLLKAEVITYNSKIKLEAKLANMSKVIAEYNKFITAIETGIEPFIEEGGG